ncbi:ABC transporter permease [Rubripirellula sp.]|nr:ABC transporter permease [Rubripirellula sp.]
MFTLLAPLQLLVLSSLASVGAAASVAQEKDRRTLLLLLLTRLSGFEIVVGKLGATLLVPFALLLGALPLFLILPLMGGVSPMQVFGVFAVTAVTVLLAGSVGTVIGLWREKTFQAIAMTVLVLLAYLGIGESIASQWSDIPLNLQIAVSPVRALAIASSPMVSLSREISFSLGCFILSTVLLSSLILALGVIKVRIWNPSRELRLKPTEEDEKLDAEDQHISWRAREPKPVWDNPILWREIRTWAYGRKIVIIRIAFVLLFCLIAAVVQSQISDGVAYEAGGRIGRALPSVTLPLAGLGVISLVLINALAVNSVTNERDGLALDLLLVTDLSPKEFVFGKLLGVMFVGKEMVLLPLMLMVFMALQNVMSYENMVYSILGALILITFVIMLGIHCGLNYVSGRTAILNSIGTVFFLCVGIAICMTIMVSFRGAFQLQLAPFLVMILGGGAALFASLGWRNPSSAIFFASFGLPLVTFYAITQFLLQTDHLYVFVALLSGYLFTTAAMMVPALSEFDVSLERGRGAVGDEN